VLQRFEIELQRSVWEDNGFVFNGGNYCCLKIKLTYFVALLYPL